MTDENPFFFIADEYALLDEQDLSEGSPALDRLMENATLYGELPKAVRDELENNRLAHYEKYAAELGAGDVQTQFFAHPFRENDPISNPFIAEVMNKAGKPYDQTMIACAPAVDAIKNGLQEVTLAEDDAVNNLPDNTGQNGHECKI